MAKMKAIMAAVLVMEKEGVSQAFGVPGAAINPLYAALRERGLRSVAIVPLGYRAEGDWLVNLKKVRRPRDQFVTEVK